MTTRVLPACWKDTNAFGWVRFTSLNHFFDEEDYRDALVLYIQVLWFNRDQLDSDILIDRYVTNR